MEGILTELVKGKKFELLINTKIFSLDIVLQAAYAFLDKGYFFFDMDEHENIILQFTSKPGMQDDPRIIIGEFSDELLDMTLRDRLEKENKEIRETIVKKAINGPLDIINFVSFNTDTHKKQDAQDDFDKDIHEILHYIENDSHLNIDQEEIESILKEIEKDTIKPNISMNIDALEEAKNNFKKSL